MINDDDAGSNVVLTKTVDGTEYTTTTSFSIQSIMKNDLDQNLATIGTALIPPLFAYPIVFWTLLAQVIPFFYGRGRRWSLVGIFLFNWVGGLWLDILCRSLFGG